MISRCALLALLATACSPGGSGDGGNAAAPASDDRVPTAVNVPAPATPANAGSDRPSAPRPGVLKTFRDWTVGCDNGLTCTMIALGSELAEPQAVSLVLARTAGRDGRFRASVAGQSGDLPAVVVDGKRIAAGDGAGIAAAIANGRTLSAVDAAGVGRGAVSLAGASAALRYIDAMQGRAGGTTAIVAKGPASAVHVPAAPALPVVMALIPGGTAARPTAAQIAAMARAAQCEIASQSGIAQTPEIHPVGGGTSLIFLPCSSGAYNLSSAIFAMKDGAFAAARADVPTGFTEDGAAGNASVVNGGFEDGLATSYAKGRGIGDCGVVQKLAWDGTMLRLVEQDQMGECRGSTDMIPTWRARVVRR